MRITHDLLARVWVTEPDEPSQVRWRARLVVGRDEGRTFAALVDSAGVGDTVEVKAISGRWLETVDGAEWAWAPTHGHPTTLAAAYALTADAADVATLAEVAVLEPDDLPGELDSFTVAELQRLAAAAGHTGTSRLRKAELIALLSEPD